MTDKREIIGKIFAHLLAILSVMFSVLDIRIAGFSAILPLFDLIIIFYFAIFRNIFAIWFLFLLGLYHDSLNGNMVGITSLCYILSVKIFNILNHRLIIRKSFEQIWQQFSAFMIVFLIFKWALLSIFSLSFYSINIVIIQIILTSVLYILSHKYLSYFIANFK